MNMKTENEHKLDYEHEREHDHEHEHVHDHLANPKLDLSVNFKNLQAVISSFRSQI
jgi:ABC-type Zn2+ transport system substrate-binding protein/surface adhesin